MKKKFKKNIEKQIKKTKKIIDKKVKKFNKTFGPFVKKTKNIIDDIKQNILKYKYGPFILKNLKTFIGLILLVIISFSIFMCSNKSYQHELALKNYQNELKKHPRNSFTGNSFVTDTYPIFRDVMLIGDSYAHFVSYDIGFDVINYSCPGLTLERLEPVFNVALKIKKKYVTIFIGPNDFYDNASLEKFSGWLSYYVDEIREKTGAKVILCTYLHSVFSKIIENNKTCAHSIDEYNAEIKKIVDEKNGVYFLDLSELDEHEKYRKDTPNGPDEIHYNYDFSIKYINKLYDKLMYIKLKEIENG